MTKWKAAQPGVEQLQKTSDLAAIQQLILRERSARDMQEWETLASCFTEDSQDHLHNAPALNRERLSEFRPSYQHLSYVLSESGHPIANDLPGFDKPDTVRALVASVPG